MSLLNTHRLGFSLVELVVVIAIIAILAGMLMAALQKVREKGRQMVCMNNLEQIGRAIHLYANDYDGYLVPLSSGTTETIVWQKLLLPYLDKYGSVPEYGSGVPIGEIYRCPSGQADIPWYNGVVFWYYTTSDYCPLYGINFGLYNPTKIEDVPRPSEKILVGEIQHAGIVINHYAYYNWYGGEHMECPEQNALPEPTTPRGRHLNAYRHNDGANFLFVDGHGEWWPRLGKDWKDPDIDGAYNKHWDLTHP